MNEAVCNEVVNLLKKRPELYDPLNIAVELEKEKSEEYDWKGWEWYELPAQPQTLKQLVLRRILKINDKTRNRTRYLLTDVSAVREALKITAILMLDVSEGDSISDIVPVDIFDDIVGYEDVKQLFLKGLMNPKEDRVHFSMIGPPASAKSLFLFCLERLPKTKYVLGSRVSRAGLADYLITYEPKYLLVDEVDKMLNPDYAILLSLCETGRVTETLYGKTREVELDTMVFASGNRTVGIPGEVMSRFEELHFLPYSKMEFMEIVLHLLTRRSISHKLAQYIGEKVVTELRSRDIREALRVAKLAKNKIQVDSVVRTLKKYRKTEVD